MPAASAHPSVLATAAGPIGPAVAGEMFARYAGAAWGPQEGHPAHVVVLAIAKAFPAGIQRVPEADSLHEGVDTGRCLPWSSDVCLASDQEK